VCRNALKDSDLLLEDMVNYNCWQSWSVGSWSSIKTEVLETLDGAERTGKAELESKTDTSGVPNTALVQTTVI
jgi:hypothetical protein